MSDIVRELGAFSWHELMTTDPAGAKAFYGELLGWQFRDEPMPDMTYTIVKAGSNETGGLMQLPPQEAGMPPSWGVYMTVADVDVSARRAVELGGKVLMQPQDIPETGRFAVIQDPQGATFSIISYT